MGRVSSSTLNAYRDVVESLMGMGFTVEEDSWYEWAKSTTVSRFAIKSTDGQTLIAKALTNRDYDVTYNEATEWLRKMYEQLKFWK